MYRVEKGVEEFTDIEEEIKKVVFKFVEASFLLSNFVGAASSYRYSWWCRSRDSLSKFTLGR